MIKYIQYLWYFLCTVFVLLVGFCLYFLYMPFYFPKPTGSYAVGTHQYHWIDTARQEKRARDPQHPHRELMVRAWYPTQAQPTDKVTAPYAPVLMEFFSQENKTFIEKITAFFSGLYRPIYAYYSPNAPLATSEQAFPVIIFSHGFGLCDDLYTAYCSELATHGYVIFSINHTYDNNITVFPDGRRVVGSFSAIEKLFDEARRVFFSNNIETWVADVRYVLNTIESESQNESSKFYKKLNLAHVGIFGHSYGAATTIQCCRQDKRFVAGCSLDGLLYGVNFDKPFSKPFMFIRAERSEFVDTIIDAEKNKKWHEVVKVFTHDINQLAKYMNNKAYIIDFAKAEHMTFSDYAIIKYAGLFPKIVNYDTGTVNGFEITARVNSYLVAFFDKYLKDLPTDMLDAYRM